MRLSFGPGSTYRDHCTFPGDSLKPHKVLSSAFWNRAFSRTSVIGFWRLLQSRRSAWFGLPVALRHSALGIDRTRVALLLMSYSAAASKLPGSCEAVTGWPSRRHQSSPPSNSLARNPSRVSLYAPLVDALQPIPSQ